MGLSISDGLNFLQTPITRKRLLVLRLSSGRAECEENGNVATQLHNTGSLGAITIIRHYFARCIVQFPGNHCQNNNYSSTQI